MTRNDTILSLLGKGPTTAQQIAATVLAPVPSVRRSIAELRAAGHLIQPASPNGVYRLQTAMQTTAPAT